MFGSQTGHCEFSQSFIYKFIAQIPLIINHITSSPTTSLTTLNIIDSDTMLGNQGLLKTKDIIEEKL